MELKADLVESMRFGNIESDVAMYTARSEDGRELKIYMFSGYQDGIPDINAVVSIVQGGKLPALGGTRFIEKNKPFTESDIENVLEQDMHLALDMDNKLIVNGFDYAGAKGCLITRKKDKLTLEWYGRCVRWLDGKFYTAADAGTDIMDLMVMSKTGAPYVCGLSKQSGGGGDTAIPTAVGIVNAMNAYCAVGEKKPSLLKNKTVVVLGATGKVGGALAYQLAQKSAILIIADLPQTQGKMIAFSNHLKKYGNAEIKIMSLEEALETECDILAPCVRPSGIINALNIPHSKYKALIGSTNGILQRENALTNAQMLKEMNICFLPDPFTSAGGVENIIDELNKKGYNGKRAYKKIGQIRERVEELILVSRAKNISPYELMIERIDQKIKERKNIEIKSSS